MRIGFVEQYQNQAFDPDLAFFAIIGLFGLGILIWVIYKISICCEKRKKIIDE